MDEHRSSPQPGWYQDPLSPELRRWWDGALWTNETAPLGDSQPRSTSGVDSPSGAVVPDDTRVVAVTSLASGIVGWVLVLLVWPLGIVVALVGLTMGIVALRRIGRREAQSSSRGLALAGVIASGVALATLPMILVFWGVLWPALF